MTPILVMLAALLLQRFEAVVLDQVDPTPAQGSLITSPSLPQYGFDAGSVGVTLAEASAALSIRQPFAGGTPVATLADTAVLVSVKIPSTEAIPSPRAPLISAVAEAAGERRRTDVVQATTSLTVVLPDSALPENVDAPSVVE